MTDARLMLAGRLAGSAFIAAPRLAITAHHVVRDRGASEIRLIVPGSHEIEVDDWEGDPVLDAARLHLRTDEAGWPEPGTAVEGARWTVLSRPLDNDAALTGTIAAVAREIVNDGGHIVQALQLTVDQELHEFGGYSGAAVRQRDDPRIVIGMLCEQVKVRLRTRDRPASNVLYAIPINKILWVPTTTPDVFGAVATALAFGDLAAAERHADARRDWPGYSYWKARIALAGHNPAVASALLGGDPRDPASIALKIQALLLQGGSETRNRAVALAEAGRGVSARLDAWLENVARQGLFEPGIRTEAEFPPYSE